VQQNSYSVTNEMASTNATNDTPRAFTLMDVVATNLQDTATSQSATQRDFTPTGAATTLKDSVPSHPTSRSATPAALLKLCGETPLWKIIYGDAVSHVGVLNTLYPFHVEVALVAPNAAANADVVHRASSRYAVSYENGWFLSSFEVALAFFGTVVSGVIPEMDVEMPREDGPTATHNATAAPIGR